VDILLEVTPTEEQKAERIKEQKEQESKRRMSKEKEHETLQEKYRPREEDAAWRHAKNTQQLVI
jgi:hypothetical protein